MKLVGLALISVLLCTIPVQGAKIVFRMRWLKNYKVTTANSCFVERFLRQIFGGFIPRCINLFDYHHEQTDGKKKWCAHANGEEIDYTRAKIKGFPYNCKKTRECPKHTVRESSGRCETTCEYAATEGFDPKLNCNNRCICPRNKYRSKSGICVRFKNCSMPACSPSMVYTKCASKCPRTCATLQPKCKPGCKEGVHCACSTGMVLWSKNNQTCLKEEDCPNCGHGSIATDCAPRCADTCFEDKSCGGCEEGVYCMCPPGTIRLDRKLPVRCVPKDQCQSKCAPPRVLKGCGTACPPTCDEPDPKCTNECEPENICSCPDGYVQRSTNNKTCVAFKDCPKERLECKAPSQPVKCSAVCPPICEDSAGSACSRQCNPDFGYVCGCPDGYVQKSRDNDTCIKPDECPQNCTVPKVFKQCPSKCQPTCANPRANLNKCDTGCREDTCVCPEEMVLLNGDSDKCVMSSQCPKNCTSPKMYKECPSNCQPTCENMAPDFEECDSGCREDVCVCPEGMVLLDDNSDKCVTPFQCPKNCEFPKVRSFCRPTCAIRCDTLDTLDVEECNNVECGEAFCACADGYLLRSESDPTCVPLASCPPTQMLSVPSDPAPIRCKFPEVRANCRTTCSVRCDNLETLDVQDCDVECGEEFCACADGYLQKSESNQTCVPVESCLPLVAPAYSDTSCKEPKIFEKCVSKCRPTCETPNPVFCDKSCEKDLHCVCPPGMVHPKNGNNSCVPLSECPKSCTFPSVATDCAPACPATCDKPAPNCTKPCDPNVKCVCPNGLLRVNLADSSCVLPTQCPDLPRSCPFRKIPTACASGCPATCENQRPRFCSKPCRSEVKCECVRGMVQKSQEDDTCVWPQQCDT